MIWAINEDGMRVRADDYELRHNYFLLQSAGKLLPKLYAPCCNSPVTFVQPQLDSRAYFRHPKFAKCEFAVNNEYLESLHWEIADKLEEFSLNSKKWNNFLKKSRNISIFQKWMLKTIYLFTREHVFQKNGKVKRADILLNHLILEIQCSNISIEEINERIRFYSHYPNMIRWILGFPAHKSQSICIEFPIYANEVIKTRFKEQAFQYRKYKQNISKYDFYLHVIVLNRWQTYLIQHHHVSAIYYRGFLYPKFRYGEIYTAVNPLEFAGACRKIRFVILDQKTKY